MNNRRADFEEQVYGSLERNIDAAKQKTFSAMKTSSAELGKIKQIRGKLRSLLDEIQKNAVSPL